VGGADLLGDALVFCGESDIGAEHRKMSARAWINIFCLAELGPAITPILRWEHWEMQMNDNGAPDGLSGGVRYTPFT
jgi:hypothetical protein